jgi:PAS domain S-box-containing protein
MKPVRRVLILNDLGTLSSPGFALVDQAIHGGLQSSQYQIELYNESLETTLFSDEASQRRLRDWYIRKYHERKPDVIIAVGIASLKFMIETHETSFPKIPIIFCGGSEEMLGQLKPDIHFTGAWGVTDPEKTLNVALHLQPRTRHVVVVGGVGAFDRDVENIVRARLQQYESTFDITYLTDLDMQNLIDRLSHLPQHTIVLHTSITQDASGTRFIDATQSVPLVVGAATAPVFVLEDVDVGGGAVGGDVSSWADQGRIAAGMALKILNGENPRDIPIAKGPDVYLFDWRALQRWGLRAQDLPLNSTVLYHQPSLWELYKWYIIGGLFLILAETLLILQMLWMRARQRKVENALVVVNDRLRIALEGAGCMGWDLNLKTGRAQWFGDLATIFGIPSDARDGNVEEFYQRVHPGDRERVARAGAIARKRRTPYVDEFRFVRVDGAERWISARGKYYYGSDGGAERMLGIATDITERKQTEEALKKSEEKFSKAFRHSPVVLTITTAKESRYVEVNEAFLQITGWNRDEVIGQTPAAVGLWVDAEARASLATRLLSGDVIRNLLFKIRTKDGEIRDALGSAELVDVHGEPCVLSVAVDVTDLKHAEEKLRENEKQFRMLADTAPVMIWMSGSDKLCTFFNKPWLDFTGRTMDQEVGDGWTESVHPEDHDRCLKAYSVSFDAREPFRIEYRLRRFDGEYRWILDHGIPLFSPGGDFHGYIGSCIDITERKAIEEELRESKERLAGIVSSAMDAIITVDDDQRVIVFNEAAERMFDLPIAEAIGQPLDRFIPGLFLAAHVKHLQRPGKAGKASGPIGRHGTFRAVRKDDSQFPIEASVSNVKVGGQGLYTIFIRDITEQKRAEAEREQLEQAHIAQASAETANRSKDEFLALVSHEMRTPLNTILGYTYLLHATQIDKENIDKAATVIERNVNTQLKMVEDLLDSARIIAGKLRIEPVPVELAPVLEAALDTARSAAGAKGVALVTDLDPQGAEVLGDPVRLQQVVSNLLTNAVKFTPEGGRVELRMHTKGERIHIIVRDTGKGIEPEFLPSVFDRFRQADPSSARRSGGLGLGLSLVKQLVELHGGTVTAESQGAERGSTFTVKLPRRRPEPVDLSRRAG